MFGTQRLSNNLPLNTRIRNDPSSFGARFFSVQGDFLDKYRRDLIRLKLSYYPLTSFTDLADTLYSWDISDFEFTYNDEDLNLYIINPSVYGDNTLLSIVTNTVDLLNEFPTSITLSETLSSHDAIIYDEDTDATTYTINDIEIAGHLYLEITNVDSFIRVVDTTNNKSPIFKAKIHLEGEDANGNEIIEDIFPNRNGIYKTLNRYSKLISIYVVNIIGASGHLVIKSLDFDITSYRSLFNTAVMPENEFELLKEFDSNFFYLRYPIFPIEAGTRVNEDKETVVSFKALNSNLQQVAIDDITFIQNTEDLIILSDDKLLFYSDWLPPVFTAPANERTREIVVTVDPLTRYPGLDEDLKCFIYTRSISKRINAVTISLIDPDGDIFYLNDNMELQSNIFTFLGDNSDWPADTFSDRTFEFAPDKIGQWEFVITVTDTDDNEYIDVSCFIVAALTPEKELTLNKNYESVSFGEDGKIYCFDGTDIDIYLCTYDICFISSEDGTIYTRESYDEIEVVYE